MGLKLEPNCASPGWVPGGTGIFMVSDMHVANNLSVWKLREVRPQRLNWFFLVDFLVTVCSNLFFYF